MAQALDLVASVTIVTTVKIVTDEKSAEVGTSSGVAGDSVAGEKAQAPAACFAVAPVDAAAALKASAGAAERGSAPVRTLLLVRALAVAAVGLGEGGRADETT